MSDAGYSYPYATGTFWRHAGEVVEPPVKQLADCTPAELWQRLGQEAAEYIVELRQRGDTWKRVAGDRIAQPKYERTVIDIGGVSLECFTDPSLPQGTIRLIAGPRPENQLTVTGLSP